LKNQGPVSDIILINIIVLIKNNEGMLETLMILI